MYLMHKQSGDLVEILTLDRLFDPFAKEVSGCLHAGEELQDATDFSKAELLFPSGEYLPRCWVDPSYKDKLRQAQR